jgi:hypothetical protein
MEKIKSPFFEKLGKIFSLLFQLVLFLFLASLLINEIYPDFIPSFMDLSWFLLFIIILGVFTLIFPTNYVEGIEKQVISRDFVFMVLLGTMIGYNIFLRLKGSQLLGIYFGLICGIATITILLLIILKKRKALKKEELTEKDTEPNTQE